MVSMFRILILLGALTLIACQSKKDDGVKKGASAKKEATSSKKAPLANGFYAVLGTADSEEEARGFGSERVALMSFKYHRYEEGEEKDKPLWLAVNGTPDVPLTLGEKAKTENDKKGSPLLQLQLDEKAAKDLESFTSKHLGKTVAIIIDGEVITKHTVKAALKGGKIQISWCSASACETLKLKLQ